MFVADAPASDSDLVCSQHSSQTESDQIGFVWKTLHQLPIALNTRQALERPENFTESTIALWFPLLPGALLIPLQAILLLAAPSHRPTASLLALP